MPPQLIRLMGRWSSDVYEIYCRMSAQAAARVGVAVTSADVDPMEPAFATEQLELLQSEVEAMRAAAGDAGMEEDEM